MTGNDFNKLIAAWLDGRLSVEDSQALQEELRESETARASFRKYAELDARLHEVADTSDMLGTAKKLVEAASSTKRHARESEPIDSIEAETTGATRVQSRATLPPTRSGDSKSVGSEATIFSRFVSTRLASWYTALAAGMLLVVSLLSYFNSGQRGADDPQQIASADEAEKAELVNVALVRKPPAPVATLAAAERALWENRQIEVKQALYEGEAIRLQEGKVRISVGFGAEIVAEAPCWMTLRSTDRVELHEGKVAVDVAPWAKGFTVVTQEMDIVDLGTTFTVSAAPGVNSETTVLKGVVRVHPTQGQDELRRGLLVTEGQQISVDNTGLHKSVKQLETLRLLSSLDFGGSGPYRPVNLNNTGLGLSVGDEDLHWRVVAGPDGSFSGAQFASVCVPHKAYLPNDAEKSQWISIVDWQTAAANSTYTFQTSFNLEGYDLSTMQLFGRFLADNGVSAVRVNGKSVEVQSWVDNVKYQPFRDQQFRFVNVTKGLVEGRNVIDVDVRNGMQRKWDKKHKAPRLSAIPNPMALRVEWYAFGRKYDVAKDGNNAKLFRQRQQQVSPRLALSYMGPEI